MQVFISTACLLLLLVSHFSLFGQNDASVEMADAMRESGKIYVVVGVLVIIFLGIAIYLFSIDRKVKKLEKEIENKA